MAEVNFNSIRKMEVKDTTKTENKVEKTYKVKFQIVDKELHDKVLAIVNTNREKEKKFALNSLLPIRAHNTDAKYDIFAQSCTWDEKNDCWVYGINYRLESEVGYYLSFVPRSSNRKTECYLANSLGIGDYGYRGEYIFCFKPRTSSAVRKGLNLMVKVIGALCAVTGLVRWQQQVNSFRIENKPPYEVGDRIGQMSVEKVNEIAFEEANLNPDETERGEGGHGSTGK